MPLDRNLPNLTDRWERQYWLLKQFKKQYGHCQVPRGWRPNPALALWVAQQQAAQLQNTLDPTRRRRLQALGLKWLAPPRQRTPWEERFKQLKAYKRRFGHCDMPADWAKNQPLADWMHNQRAFHYQGKLSAERIQRLESIGFAWQATGRLAYSLEARWDASYDQLAEFKKRFGHCNVPAEWAENRRLAKWVTCQRVHFNDGKLDSARQGRLEALGFLWDAVNFHFDQRWERQFEQLMAYKARFGHCDMPADWAENQPLANWVQSQRAFHSRGKLSEERTRRLEAIGFSWFAPGRLGHSPDVNWEGLYQQLVQYKKRFGHCNVACEWRENRKLGRWVIRQRGFYRDGNLAPDRRRRLEALGFLWDVTNLDGDQRWESQFEQLMAYKTRFGHCDVPGKWAEDQVLGTWVHTQRSFYARGDLTAERIRRLEDIGFRWAVR